MPFLTNSISLVTTCARAEVCKSFDGQWKTATIGWLTLGQSGIGAGLFGLRGTASGDVASPS